VIVLRESYIANWKNLPEDSVKIRVARPSVLGPSKELLKEFKEMEKRVGRFRAFSEGNFDERYRQEILSNQKAVQKIKDIVALLEEGKDVYLICYEKSAPCHRFVLMEIINKVRGKE
jgi:uncharacterized protein YeaO (DUF488 family)